MTTLYGPQPGPAASATAHLRRLWRLLPALQRDVRSAAIDQLNHAQQCASLAWNATGSAEWALAGLFHDIGRLLDPLQHGVASAVMLSPVLSAEPLWVVRMHDEFMLPYSPIEIPVNRFMRDRHRDHPCFARACEFADRWDSRAFAPSAGLPLAFFEGLLFRHVATLDSARMIAVPGPSEGPHHAT